MRAAVDGRLRTHFQVRSQGGRSPGLDRLAGQVRRQVIGQVIGSLVTVLRLLFQALQADRLEVAVEKRLEPPGRHGLGVLDEVQGRQDGVGQERRPGRSAARRGWLPAHRDRPRVPRPWLGHRPVRGPCSWASRGSIRSGSAPSSLRASWPGRSRKSWARRPGVIKMLAGFRSRWTIPQPMRLGGSPSQALQELGSGSRGPGGPVEPRAEASPLDVLEFDIRPPLPVADRVDLDDVGMLEPGDRLGLGGEAGERVGTGVVPGQDHLQGHFPVQADLAGPVDDAHRASAEFPQDLVAGDLRLPGHPGSRPALGQRGGDCPSDGRPGRPARLPSPGERAIRWRSRGSKARRT